MKIYETMRQVNPDFFIHSGDNIYADGVIQPQVTLDDGTIWKNITTPEKSKVAETLTEYRGNYPTFSTSILFYLKPRLILHYCTTVIG